MNINIDKIRSYRLRAHHLDKKIPLTQMIDAADACGLQNSPPGAWETALFLRLENCTRNALHDALYNQKTLLQAWSYRGVPVVFPTIQSDIFLSPLIAYEDEHPWIYTRGITGALDHLQMSFDDLLVRTKKALLYLDHHTILSKEALDQTIADIIQEDLPPEKRSQWCEPSMYGNPDKQTVGGAAVSFLLRPCAFHSLVIFGERQGNSPTFTSFKNWTGHEPEITVDADKQFVRKFLHCYGPATADYFMNWLGCSKQQAKRLWNSISEEITPVKVEGKTHFMLTTDMDDLMTSDTGDETLILLGAHDPYLDLKDRAVILHDKARQKIIWQFVSNPGAVLKGGRVIGSWKTKTLKNKLDVSITVWEAITSDEQQTLKQLAEEFAAFRLLPIQSCIIDAR